MVPGIGSISGGEGGITGGAAEGGKTSVEFGGFGGSSLQLGNSGVDSQTLLIAGAVLVALIVFMKVK